MNEVQEYILKRAMQKLANDQNKKVANDQYKKVPWEYAVERINAYDRQAPLDRILNYQTPGAIYNPNISRFGEFQDLDNKYITELPILRERQARKQASRLGTVPGSDEYNALVKYLIEQGETNWHNFNNPKDPKPSVKAPTIKDESGEDIAPKRIQDAGRTMVSTDNYKKFSGNA